MAGEMTYTLCPLCHASGTIPTADPHRRAACPCLRSPSPGYAATGLTVGQIERMVLVERCLVGDPGVPVDERSRVIVALRERVDKAEARLAEGEK